MEGISRAVSLCQGFFESHVEYLLLFIFSMSFVIWEKKILDVFPVLWREKPHHGDCFPGF